MKYGHITGVEKPVSRLIMGSVMFSTRDIPYTCTLLDHFVALGGNTIDTARSYGNGDCERAVGAWLAQRGNRNDVNLIGKGAHPDSSGPRVTPAAIASDLEETLEHLGTDHLDLYLLHRDDPSRPVGEIVECLNEHHAAGRIRAFGGSNWSTERLSAANEYAREHGLVPFTASSPNFSLAVWNEPPWSGCLAATVEGKEWYVAHQFPLLAWSSQAQGFFTGRYSPDDRSNAEMVRAWYNDDNFRRLERAQDLGWHRGTSATAVALAYVLCQPFPTFALIGPQTTQEMDSSAAALQIELSPDELQWLDLSR